MTSGRDFDAELQDAADHKYAYDFDFDVMHRFKLEAFQPFFREGSLLELGSHAGSFTSFLKPLFADITCVEASISAIAEARSRLGGTVAYIEGRIESVDLPRRYDNVVMTHVLEHLDDPVQALTRVNSDWLTDSGRAFLVVPNADAPSRQIAVHMGLITHTQAVTEAEAQHGHRRTYAMDTFERDVVAAGLKVVHRSGIFFKALANFQWDRLLGTDIISPSYLEGCFKLGQRYPELCASLFLVCERGDRR